MKTTLFKVKYPVTIIMYIVLILLLGFSLIMFKKVFAEEANPKTTVMEVFRVFTDEMNADENSVTLLFQDVEGKISDVNYDENTE